MRKLKIPLFLAAVMLGGTAAAQEKENNIDEVVLIGYGTTKKKDATGAISSLKAEDFNKGTTTSPEQLIQGKTAGVQITSASGDPNAQSTIRVRGFGTLRSGGDPLYVVDGVPLSSGDTSSGRSDALGYGSSAAANPMNFLDPNDIESIDILKDAAATAIYGSRAANGVILITTKKGKRGKGMLSLSANAGTSEIAHQYKLLNAEQFAANTNPANNYGSNVNAMKEILRAGNSNQYNLAYGGASEKGTYRVSLSYLEQNGIIKNSGLNKTNASYNMSQKFFDDYLTIESSLSASFVRTENPPMSESIGAEGDLMISALKWNPTRSFYDSSVPGGLFHYGNDNQRNPLDLLQHYTDKSNTLRMVGNISATVKINKNLNYKSNFGIDYSDSQKGIAMSTLIWLKTPYQINGVGVASIGTQNKFNYVSEHTLNYSGRAFDGLKIDGLLGYSYQQFADRGMVSVVSGFGNMTDQNYYLDNIFAGTTQNTSGVGAFRQSSYMMPTVKMQSFFGRAILNFYDKYIINGILRYDGSSKFGENNRYGAFPSVSVAWNVGKEDFTPEFFNELKLRGGWGITGNSDFPSGAALTYLQPLSGVWRTYNYGNPDLRWEQTRQLDGGLDFAIFNNRVSGSFDFYSKESKDILMQQYQVQRPSDNPYSWTNLKNTRITNKGVEMSVNYKIVKTDDFELEIGGNGTYNKSKATGVTADGYNQVNGIITGTISGQGLSDVRAQGHFDGQELYQFNLYQFRGFDANGLSLYEKADGSTTTDVGQAVKRLSGSALPKWNVGLNLKMSYKSFDLFVNGYGQYGGKIYDNTANALFYAAALQNGGNVTTDIIGNGESAANSNAASTRFLHSGDFFRLSNASLGYTIKGQGGIFEHITSIRLNVTAQNLFVITGYKGFDPEVNVNKMFNGIPSYGIDYAAYPKARTFSMGLNVNF